VRGWGGGGGGGGDLSAVAVRDGLHEIVEHHDRLTLLHALEELHDEVHRVEVGLRHDLNLELDPTHVIVEHEVVLGNGLAGQRLCNDSSANFVKVWNQV
jgi:hypothetical protein